MSSVFELIYKGSRDLTGPGSAEILTRHRNIIAKTVGTTPVIHEELDLFKVTEVYVVLVRRLHGEASAPLVLGERGRVVALCKRSLEKVGSGGGPQIEYVKRPAG